MLKVGFILNFPLEYKGGINYLKNLFFAVSENYYDDVKIYLFVPNDLGQEYISIFEDYATIVKTRILQRNSFLWILSRIGQKLLSFDIFYYLLLKKHQIDVVSHSNYVFPGKNIKSINWIPDFQYLHYPHLWTPAQLRSEHALHRTWIKASHLIVVSSYDAFNDLKNTYPDYVHKVRVLHFVSQPDILKQNSEIDIAKYVEGQFFYLPNQFWEHKNHLTVFKAIKILKDAGSKITLLTSGLMHDYRGKSKYVERLQKYVVENELTENIKFLGLIPYNDVLGLIKKSLAVINPSFFEGWSSTVEEAKSIGKPVILSDIPVHREQNPLNGFYFKPDDERELAEVLEIFLNRDVRLLRKPTKYDLLNALNKRTLEFAANYKKILDESIVLNNS